MFTQKMYETFLTTFLQATACNRKIENSTTEENVMGEILS